MSTPVVRPLARALAIALAAAPLLFGVVRAAQTRSDFRYLVLALASLASAALVLFVGRRGGRVTAARATLSFVVATLAGMGTGFNVHASPRTAGEGNPGSRSSVVVSSAMRFSGDGHDPIRYRSRRLSGHWPFPEGSAWRMIFLREGCVTATEGLHPALRP